MAQKLSNAPTLEYFGPMVALSEIILLISLLSEKVFKIYDTTVPTHKAKSKGFDLAETI